MGSGNIGRICSNHMGVLSVAEQPYKAAEGKTLLTQYSTPVKVKRYV